MSLFSKILDVYRVANEGRATAKAYLMAEEFLGEKLPASVGLEGYERVSSMADVSSVEEMAMIYVTEYAKAMDLHLKAIDATQDERLRVARSVARACISFARLQRSGAEFSVFWLRDLIHAAQKVGVKTDSEHISLAV